MYKKMALKTNPFGPSFPDNPENRKRIAFLTDLDRKPLRLDKCDDQLRPLFCERLLDLETHMADFHTLMAERDYVFKDDRKRGMDSALVVVRGSIGSGKSTLGAWMIAEVARLPGDPLACFHVAALSEDTDIARSAALKQLRDRVVEVPVGSHVAAMVENVSAKGLDDVIKCFEELDDWPRLFVVTTHNLKLLDADEKKLRWTPRIEVVTLRQITPADADAYVAHRVPLFRDPPDVMVPSPVFPFAPGQAGKFIQGEVDKGEAPVVLRQLNTHFRRKLAEHARRLNSARDPDTTAAITDLLLPEV